jgi:hypothetical protein
MVLNFLSEQELRKPDYMARLFIASCPDGCPFSYEEAASCFNGVTGTEALNALADQLCAKLGRDTSNIHSVIWKSTRMVGAFEFWQQIGGRFIILSRNPLNVYGSQFRVGFGHKNHNPLRYALFDASYEVAFKQYPSNKTLHLTYENMPQSWSRILGWLESAGKMRPEDATKSVQSISGRCNWHTEIDKPFENKDAEKLLMISKWRRMVCTAGINIFSLMPALIAIVRKIADNRQINTIRKNAAKLNVAPSYFSS